MAEEVSGDEWDLTLWGERVYRARGKRGRPPFQRTDENARKVSMLLAAGWTNERIARTVIDPRTGEAISVPTLKRYFRPELKARDAARDRIEARRLMRVWEAAEKGNVAAEREFARLLERNDRMETEREFASRKKPTLEAQGKKALAADKARAAEADLMAELEAEAGATKHGRPH